MSLAVNAKTAACWWDEVCGVASFEATLKEKMRDSRRTPKSSSEFDGYRIFAAKSLNYPHSARMSQRSSTKLVR